MWNDKEKIKDIDIHSQTKWDKYLDVSYLISWEPECC